MAPPAPLPPSPLQRAIDAVLWVERTSWSGLVAAGLRTVQRALVPERPVIKADALDVLAAAFQFPSAATTAQAGWRAALDFPYVMACARAISLDLAKLPLRVQDGRGPKARRVDEARVLDLIERPNSAEPGVLFRQHVVLHYVLAGEAWIEPVPLVGRPVSLIWHHPDNVLPQRDPYGRLIDVTVQTAAGARTFRPGELIHVAFPSLGPDGEPMSPVRSLALELQLDWHLRDRALKSAQRGGPDVLLHPEGSDAAMEMMPPLELQQARQDLRVQMARHRGEPMLMPRRLGVTPLGFSQVELETLEQRVQARDAVLAAFGVPPVRVGLPTANYAQSKEMMAMYWGDSLPGYAQMVDAAFTEIARRLDEGPPSRAVFHDFSDSPAMQQAELDRLDRVRMHIGNGMDGADAYAYEGLEDAPMPRAAAPAPPPPAAKAVTKSLTDWYADAFRPAVEPVATAAADENARWWRGYVARVHGPLETRMAVEALHALRAQRDAAVQALDANAAAYDDLRAQVPKGIAEDLVDLLVPADDAGRLGIAVRSLLREALGAGFGEAATSLDYAMDFDPVRVDPEVDGRLAELVQTHETTRGEIRALVRESLLRGDTVQTLRTAIQEHTAVSPMRALRIARTETTWSLNAGHLAGFNQAVSEGVDAVLEWISAHDLEVRFTHAALDGTTTEIGTPFVAADGDSALAPGGFSKAENNVNCRCGCRARRRIGEKP